MNRPAFHLAWVPWVGFSLLISGLVLPLFALAGYGLSERWDRTWWPEGFTVQWLESLMTQPRVLEALGRSIGVAVFSTLLGLTIGGAATIVGALYAPRLQRLLDGLSQLPFALPPVIVALCALQVYVGGLAWPRNPMTLYLLVMVPLNFPIVHRTLRASIDSLGLHSLLEAGRTLGASELRILLKVVLPMLWPALIAAGLMLFVAAALEFAVANLLLGGEHELLQPMMNSLRGSSGHEVAALILLSFLIVGIALAVALRLTERREPA